MRSLITEIRRVPNITKTAAMFVVFAALMMFSSIVWTQETETVWTPPQTIVTSVPGSGFDLDEVLADIANDLSGRWHVIYSHVIKVEVGLESCSVWTYIKYTNSAGVTEIVAEGFCSSEGDQVYGPSITVDRTDAIHVTYIYCDCWTDECSIEYTKRAVTTGVREEPESDATPSAFGLFQNSPNPFNPSTTINYQLKEQSSSAGPLIPATLNIYNIRGQLVRTLVNEERLPGSYSVTWDGKDQNGKQVSSGVYFYRLQAGDSQASKGMVLLK